jgi:hypothetical protein
MRHIRKCRDEILGNTMAQKDPEGSLMFMHTNMPSKWSLAVSEDVNLAVRRWQAISPGEYDRIEDFVELSIDKFGCAYFSVFLHRLEACCCVCVQLISTCIVLYALQDLICACVKSVALMRHFSQNQLASWTRYL